MKHRRNISTLPSLNTSIFSKFRITGFPSAILHLQLFPDNKAWEGDYYKRI
jgi:hypothetical protein